MEWNDIFVGKVGKLLVFLAFSILIMSSVSEISGVQIQTGFSKIQVNQSPETDWWATYRHDAAHTGVSTSEAPDSNETLWIYGTQHQICSSSCVYEDMVFIGSYDHYLYALNATTGLLLWKFQTDGEIFASPCVYNGKVFISASDGIIRALSIGDGQLLWNFSTWGAYHSSPVVSDGKVFVGSGFDYAVYALDENTGNLVWNFTTGGAIISSPASVDGVVYVGSCDDRVYALNATTGARVWDYLTGDNVMSSPCVAEGKVFVGSSDGNVYALKASNGEFLWSFATHPHGVSSTASSASYYEGKVFVGASDPSGGNYGSFFAINASNGSHIWNCSLGLYTYSSPAIADGKAFILSYDGTMRAFNSSNGELVWSYATDGSASTSSPAVANGRVYVGSGNGRVYCFAPMLYFGITVNPTFYDNRGEILNPSPEYWRIQFPNGSVAIAYGSETYYGQMGYYSIAGVFWKGRAVQWQTTSTFLDSNKTWNPLVYCTLPSELAFSTICTTYFLGFQVRVEGNLTCNAIGIADAQVLLSYSVTGGASWNDIMLVSTATNGHFSADWLPTATGNYIVRALWTGNLTYPSATRTLNLSVIPYENQYVFTVESNSTISDLTFDSNSHRLSFVAGGENGTAGYTKVTIAKNLAPDITKLKVHLDQTEYEYTVVNMTDSWVLFFEYNHSIHQIEIDLGQNPIPEFSSFLIIALFMIGTVLAVIAYKKKHSENRVSGVFAEKL